MRGRKPTPTNLRLIRGTDRPDRMNPDEPVVPVTVPDPPDHLTDDEKAVFLTRAKMLAGMRVMSDVDVDALAMYAVSFCRMVRADKKVHEQGEVLLSPKNYPIQNPNLAIANKARDECRRLLAEFGMTPSSRTKVRST